MSEDQGYSGNALDCLKKHNVKVGDSIKITADLTYSGILMPRYESGDDKHLVVKLGNGYNVGINVDEIQNIEIISSSGAKLKHSQERKDDGFVDRAAVAGRFPSSTRVCVRSMASPRGCLLVFGSSGGSIRVSSRFAAAHATADPMAHVHVARTHEAA